MPGIFGLVTSGPWPNLAAELAEMAGRLKHHAWYQEDRHVDEAAGLALGRIGLGFINGAGQPAANEDGSLLAVMAGELFDYPQRRRALAAAGHAFRGDSHAELLLHGYEGEGQKLFEGVGSTFAAALWDVRQGRLTLVNDRFGMKSLYYAHLPGRLLFASELKALLADAELSRRVSARGLAQFFTYGQLLGEDTLLEAVRLLPAGGWLTYDAAQDRLALDRYWRLRVDPVTAKRSELETLDEIDAAFTQAVERRTAGSERLGLSLSGGLDARTILAVIPPEREVTTVSLGMEGSIDLRCATEMARLTGRRHHNYVLNTGFLADYEQHLRHMVRLTDGHHLAQCITIPTLPLYRELGIELLLRGHVGELMHMDKAYNFSLDRQAWLLGDGAALESWLFGHLRAYMLEGIGESLFAAPYRGQVDALARESLRECLRESEGIEHPVNRISHLFVSQLSRRETALSMLEFGSVVETRLPYLDADLVAALFAAPPEMRAGEKIQAHILRRRQPAFLKVANSNTGTRLGAGRLRRAFSTFRMKALAKLGFKGYQPYERMGRWLRDDLRPLLDRLLLSEQCLQRGVFDPDVLRQILYRHIYQGHNHTYLILALMIFELGQRELIDGEGRAGGVNGERGLLTASGGRKAPDPVSGG
jgi:asparagine synthase (glutamine-hydrolysing)